MHVLLLGDSLSRLFMLVSVSVSVLVSSEVADFTCTKLRGIRDFSQNLATIFDRLSVLGLPMLAFTAPKMSDVLATPGGEIRSCPFAPFLGETIIFAPLGF